MRASLGEARPLRDGPAAKSLGAIAAEQQRGKLRIVAAAGIGMPDRFFGMLRASGLAVEELPLADHFDFAQNPFAGLAADLILITEKDAVKCTANPALAGDARIWVVPLATEIDPRLVDAVVLRLQDISRRTALGPSAA
jgi:tetraacyldisaccharide 4'-kinase